MALVDEITLQITAGKGGDGVVAWYRNRRNQKGGPAGGDGGKGGDVFLRGVRQIDVLSKYMGNNTLKAQDGQNGGKRSLEGKNGSDLFIDVPVGSVVTNLSSGEVYEITRENEQVKILSGGKGGFGNEHFKSSRNITPMEHTDGKPGQSAYFRIELQLIADAGLIGFPNAGKSTLLNALTNSKSKIGNYAFTTLEPNLGVFESYTLADIPGLIQGAAAGKGLGHSFLKHIQRTKVLIHCISVELEDVLQAYQAIRKELQEYDNRLLKKKEIIVITKVDMVPYIVLNNVLESIRHMGNEVIPVSIHNNESVRNLRVLLKRVLSS